MNTLATKKIICCGLILTLSLSSVAAGTANALTSPPTQTSDPILIEGESGSGEGILKQRSNASQLCDVWLRDRETRQYSFQAAMQGRYLIRVRYSNDNFGLLDDVEFRLDEQPLGRLTAQDTGDWGNGWNNFVWSPSIAEVELSSGPHTLSATLVRGDGVELDLMRFDLNSAVPVAQIIEGETGTGDGLQRFRSNASQEKTIWLLSQQIRQYTFEVATQTTYSISLRYSNDHYGVPVDRVEVNLDGRLIETVTLQDTGDWGYGWNQFLTVLITTATTLAPGTHTLTVKVAAGDGFELDMVKLDPQN